MPKQASAKQPTTGYQFKITLNDSSPVIWRWIVIPRNATFFELHLAIQGAMGWTESHLHAFRILEKGSRTPISIEFPNSESEGDYLDERREKIADYFGEKIKECQYEYDFGDGWEHTILFERETALDQKEKYPKCTDGQNACPPEDCGGIGGYHDLIDILRDSKHSEHENMLEWLDIDDSKEFDPTVFDPDDAFFEDPKKRLKEYEKGFGVV